MQHVYVCVCVRHVCLCSVPAVACSIGHVLAVLQCLQPIKHIGRFIPCRYLRDLHNCFHGGLAPIWLESIIMGSGEVEEAAVVCTAATVDSDCSLVACILCAVLLVFELCFGTIASSQPHS